MDIVLAASCHSAGSAVLSCGCAASCLHAPVAMRLERSRDSDYMVFCAIGVACRVAYHTQR